MSSRLGVSIFARMRLRGATRARREADAVIGKYKQLDLYGKEVLPRMERRLNDNLRLGLDVLSTVQLLRFSMRDIQELATGKGGLEDVLSLGTSAILLMYRLNTLTQGLAAAKVASMVTGIAGALGPVGLGITGGMALGGGILMGLRGLSMYQREQERRRTFTEYPTVGEQVPYGAYSQSPQFRRGVVSTEGIRRQIARRDVERVIAEIE